MRFFAVLLTILTTTLLFAQENIKLDKVENLDLKMSGEKKKGADLKVFKRDKKEESEKKKITQEDFIKKKEIEKLELVEKQILNTEELLEDMDDEDTQKPTYMLKLAEMYRKKAKGLWLKGMSFDDVEPKDKAQAEEFAKEKDNHLRRSMETTQKAVDTYALIYKTFPSYESVDAVLFAWAHTLEEMKQSTMSIKIFKQLAKDYPDSQYIPDAFLALGEYYFIGDDMDTAKKAYSKVVQYQDSELYNYAYYKLGWCEFNLHEPKKAFDMFVEILRGGDPNEKFVEQVKMDLVFIYSQFASPDKAEIVFEKLFGNPSYLEYLDKLGLVYKDRQGKNEEAIYIFRRLIELEVDEIKLFRFHVYILEASISIGKIKNLILSAIDASEFLQKIDKQYIGDKEFDKLRNELEGMIKELATSYHKQAQDTKNDTDLKIAVKFYNEYQKLFRDYDDYYPMLFQYAVLLDEQLFQPQNAIDVYIDIITSKDGKKADNLVEDAVTNALAIYSNLIKEEKAKSKTSQQGQCHKQKDIKPQKLSKRQDQFVKLIDIFIEHNPDSKELPTAKFNAAQIYYEACNFEKSIPVFEEIATKHVGSDAYEPAASLLLDVYNTRKEYTKMLYWINDFIKNKKHLSAKFIAQLQDNVEALAFMSPRELEEKKTYIEAAEAYYDFYKKYPKSQRAFYSLYNSSLMYENAAQIQDTIKIREEMISKKEFEDRKEIKDVLFFLAQNYQGIARFKDAANLYEKYYKKYPKDKNGQIALTTAIDFNEAIEESDTLKKANELIDIYIQDKKMKSKEAWRWVLKQGENIEKMGDWKSVLAFWDKFEKDYFPFLTLDHKIELQFKIANAYQKLGRDSSASKKQRDGFDFYEKLKEKEKKSLKTSKRLLAEQQFNELEKVYNSFKAIKLELPEAKMATALKKKVELKQKLTKDYNDAVREFGSAYWSIAYFFKIASLTYDFAKDIENSPIPPKLNADQKEIYKQDLMQMYVYPLEQEAFNAYFKCYEIAMKNEIFNEWVDKSIEMMLKIDPAAFKANFDEQYTTVDFRDILFEKEQPIVKIEKEGNKK